MKKFWRETGAAGVLAVLGVLFVLFAFMCLALDYHPGYTLKEYYEVKKRIAWEEYLESADTLREKTKGN